VLLLPVPDPSDAEHRAPTFDATRPACKLGGTRFAFATFLLVAVVLRTSAPRARRAGRPARSNPSTRRSASRRKAMLVRDIYRPDVDCAESDEVVVVGARRMLQRSVGSLIIVDSDRRPVGIVTDRDLVVRVLAAGANPASMTLVDVMTPTPW